MSPKYQESDVTKINGPRPLPLRVSKDSHAIQKPENGAPKHSSTKRQPVIIYTHSPKVIHAQSRDFMALVQKLTGMSRADGDKTVKSDADKEEDSVSEEKEGYDPVQADACSVSPMYKVSNNYLVDAPLFTPNSNEFFCSPRQNPMFQSPSSISPPFMAFPDY